MPFFGGGGNSGGNLPKGGNGGISQREVEQPGEHPCQLVWASFYHSLGDAIRPGSWGLPFSVCSWLRGGVKHFIYVQLFNINKWIETKSLRNLRIKGTRHTNLQIKCKSIKSVHLLKYIHLIWKYTILMFVSSFTNYIINTDFNLKLM